MTYNGKYFHLYARRSTVDFPMGFGVRVFAWKPLKWRATLDLLFLLWDMQIGFHQERDYNA